MSLVASCVLYDNLRTKKKSQGDGRETAIAQSEIVGTPHGHSTGCVRFLLKYFGDRTVSIRHPYDLRTGLSKENGTFDEKLLVSVALCRNGVTTRIFGL